MPRALEIIVGVVLILVVLPFLAFASVGLRFTGVRPLLINRQIGPRSGRVSHQMFNSHANHFGLLLRRWQIDRLPALFQVVSGEVRLAELRLLPRRG